MAKRRRRPASKPRGCPCGGSSFDSCCGPILANPSATATPEALMRSRYTAHVRNDVDHLEATWHADHRPHAIAHDPDIRWTGLDIVAAEGDEVEFVARFRRGGESLKLHERSTFVHEGGRWLYRDGIKLS